MARNFSLNNMFQRYLESGKVKIILLVAVFISFHWVSNALYLRTDLSSAGRYTITDATETIIDNLSETVTIEAFFSGQVPESHYQEVKQLKDFLKEYASISSRKIKLRFLDPDNDPEVQQRARTLGIQPLSLGSVDQQKQEIKRVFLSIALSYEDKTQVIHDIIQNPQALEYNLTARIFKLANPDQRKIGFLKTDSVFSISNQQNRILSLSLLDNSMEEFYGRLVPVDAANTAIGEEISTLLIVAPRNLTDIEKYHIDQYLMRGGKVILALSGMEVNFQNLTASPVNQDLLDFFANYGIVVEKDMVYDPQDFIPYREQVNMLQYRELPYPLWVLVPSERMDDEHTITHNINFLFFPWGSSVSIDQNKIENGAVQLLATTSDKSYHKTSGVMISPEFLKNSPEPAGEEQKPFNLAYYTHGVYQSYYNGHQPPRGIKEKPLLQSNNNAAITVLGSPFIFSDNVLQMTQWLHLNFFLSIADVMNGFEELVEARNRETSTPQLGPVDYWLKNVITLTNFILPLLIILVYGILRFIARKRAAQLTFIHPEPPKEDQPVEGATPQ